MQERVRTHLDEARRLAEDLRRRTEPTADEVAHLWNDVHVCLRNVFAVCSLLANVHPEPAVRSLAEEGEQEATRLSTDLSLDPEIFAALAAVDPDELDETGRRMLERSLRDFRRAGVDRDEATREELRGLAEEQTELTQRFARGIREGGRELRVAPDRLTGLPDDFREARLPGEDGLVVLTTDYPDYLPVMTFATDRSLRREMAAAFLDRAWPDNDGVLGDLLRSRRRSALLLGYDGWPDFDAEVKMIGRGAAIPDFVERIAALATPTAERDFGLLRDRLRQDHPDADEVESADKTFYAEVVRREQLDVDAQQVRRYFSFPRVRAGLLAVTGRLFGLEYVEVPDAASWHEDVTAYDVLLDGRRLGRIHLDLHPREGKYSHAAQFTLVPGVLDRQLPEGVLVCNFPRGLMEHHDVVTLFHEFGHLLHHLLGGHQRWVRFSGVATEWDFVEAPSQMLEEWAWDADVLGTFATDDDGRPIPSDLVARMRAAEEFGKGFAVRTQMFYAAVSYVLHAEVPEDLTAAVRAQQRRYDLFRHPAGSHFHASFGHLGGYSSAYYTYAWSEVIAKDLFSAFDPGDLFDPAVAHRYRDRVLAPGGSRDAADLVEDFLGRPWSFEAYERWMSA